MIELTATEFVALRKGSALADLNPNLADEFLAEHQVLEVPAQSDLYHEEDSPRITLLISGLLRVWIAAADGRAMTIRYVKAGEFIGIPTFLVGPAAVRVSTLTDSQICFFNAKIVRGLCDREPSVTLALARECAFNLFDIISRIGDAAFGSIRQRLAHHLLDLGVERDGEIRVDMTSQNLALAIGSVRETVSRALGELREIGAIRMARGMIVLVNLDTLKAAAQQPPSLAG